MGADQDLAQELAFGRFRLNARNRTLLCDGQKVRLRSRSLDILCVLALARGELVTKDELMSRVWRGAIVEENVLQVHVSALRRALTEDASSQRHIVTVPGQGYRFLVDPVGRQTDIVAPKLSPPVSDKPSIAVMPFQNLSGDPGQDYFADGVVEEMITALTRFPSLLVIARNSSFAYRGRSVDIRQVGRELGVRYVLEGSIRISGNRLRITGQLVQTDTGSHVWAEHYDGGLADIFTLQDELTSSVVGALVPSLQDAEIDRARKAPTANLSAYDQYLRALAFRDTLTPEGIDQALRLAGNALAIDRTFVSALMLATTCWTLRLVEGWSPPSEAHAESVRYARLAVSVDPYNADALAILARRMAQSVGNYEEARTLADRAVAINPNSANVWRYCGASFFYMGEAEIALNHLQRALQLSPRDAWAYDSWSMMALALIQLGRDEEALAAARSAVQLNVRFTTASRALAAALALTGRYDEARTEARRLLDLDPNCTMTAMKGRGISERASTRYFDGLRKAGVPE